MDQYIPIFTLIVGILIGYLLSLPNRRYYNDMRDFANAYSNLATQLFNANKNDNVPLEPEPFLRNPRPQTTAQTQPTEDNDLDMLAGILDPVRNR